MNLRHSSRRLRMAGILAAAGMVALSATAQDGHRGKPAGPPSGAANGADADKKAPEFPPFETVAKDLTKVISTADGKPGFYTLYANKKDGRLLAELPGSYKTQLILIAPTVASGDENAGVMGGSTYATWKRFDKRLALLEPNFLVRSTGDKQSKDSIEQLFTGRVVLDVPIVTMGPGGGPVIDLKALMVGQLRHFFGPGGGGFGPMVRGARAQLASLTQVKSFPKNIEVTYELPAADGRMISLHYSLANIAKDASFKPRQADHRVGYFNVYYNDLGKPGTDEPYTRYITRWKLEKADASLNLSPPKEPIVWYIEHTTPVRYRRFVREGILQWNQAFEAIGIVNAMEVYQQDAGTGAHMEKDPEDARYNFFRWNTSTQGYAIGPSRWDPRTGQIFDADVVWHAGLTNAVIGMMKNLSAEVAVMGMSPETLAWLDQNPEWDPRVRMAPPALRAELLRRRQAAAPATANELTLDSLPESDAARALRMGDSAIGQSGSACKIGEFMTMNIALFATGLEAGLFEFDDETPMLDDMPEEFLGAMIKYISSHEVGHTLGLQHNFGASTIRTLEEINSEEMEGQAFIASVMEYAAPNINSGDGEVQGHYATPTIGPYDYWAIAYGYGPEDKREEVLSEVSNPDHIFLNDIASIGPDPRAQTWDMGADPLDFAESRMRLVRDVRSRLVDDVVKDGDSWRKARDRYESLLSNHVLSLVIASRWVGGSYVNNDHKGDPGDRNPIENVDADKQRRALQFIIDNSFADDAFGLTPELLQKFALEFYYDEPGMASVLNDPAYEVHDLVAGIQAAALTILMNPTKLRRVYDNEFRTAGDENALTLAEVMETISDAIWSELEGQSQSESFTAANPMISSFRRNLQREHMERLVALSMPSNAASPSARTIATLGTAKLRTLRDSIVALLRQQGGNLDQYTIAHLTDVATRIEKALDAIYVYKD